MRLIRSQVPAGELTQRCWDELADRLIANKGKLGDLGGGNHFLDALIPYGDGPLHFLIHTGSRDESGLVDQFVDQPARFDAEFKRVASWAEQNRAQINKDIEAVFGRTELIIDLPHNTFQALPGGGAIIRKGSVHVHPGDICIIPSHMSGDVALVKATDSVDLVLCSMSHGTGRTMSRSDCKPLADAFDFEHLRQSILMPSCLDNASLRTEGPYAYRALDDCLTLVNGYVEEVTRFRVVGYMGHL